MLIDRMDDGRDRRAVVGGVHHRVDVGVIHLVEYVVRFQPQLQPPPGFAKLERPAERRIDRQQIGTRNRIAPGVSELARPEER